MCAGYCFDSSKAKPNRFASRVDKSRLVVVLDPDVSEVFTTQEAVNKALRALIGAAATGNPEERGCYLAERDLLPSAGRQVY